MNRIGNDHRVYESFLQNRGVSFIAINKLESEPLLQHVQQAVKVLLVFDFSPEQLKTNALMNQNALLNGITARATQIYQLMDAGVLSKNVHWYTKSFKPVSAFWIAEVLQAIDFIGFIAFISRLFI